MHPAMKKPIVGQTATRPNIIPIKSRKALWRRVVIFAPYRFLLPDHRIALIDSSLLVERAGGRRVEEVVRVVSWSGDHNTPPYMLMQGGTRDEV
jgi:hypothetical protein